jgi:catechol 2,3-dioxygenase-like lactoylglutathione lyase family enzyme
MRQRMHMAFLDRCPIRAVLPIGRMGSCGMQHVLGLDHVVVLVRDLAAAEARLERLGFRPTPRGVHSAHMGTANTTVVFADATYLEALAVLQPTENNTGVRAVLAEREGAYGLAFKTDDADAAAAGFAAAGIGPGVALEFARAVELPSGPGEAAFRVARSDPAHTPGAWLFVCQHRTPEATWRADYLEQPNGACGIVEVIGAAADPEAAAAAYRRIFGDRVRHDRDGVRIDAGGAAIAFLPPAAFALRFAPFGAAIDAASPRLAALRLRTASLQRTQALLSAQGVRHVATAHGTLLVSPDEACGTILEFAASLTRA